MVVRAGLRIASCGPERADEVQRLTQAAFTQYETLDPPSGALGESPQVVSDDLSEGGGAIAELDGCTVACLRWLIDARGDFYVKRLAVEPALQRSGLGHALMDWAEAEAARRDCDAVSVAVRLALPGNIEFFRRLGYERGATQRHDGYDYDTAIEMRKLIRRA